MQPTGDCHVVALPYPGRGHINAAMNVCKQLCSRKPDMAVTFVVTEEWLGLIGSEPRPANVLLAALPNVIPSEHGRAADFPGFVEAVSTRLAAPFEALVARLEPPPSVILADTFVVWAADVGERRSIPVASLFPMSGAVFSMFRHFELLKENRHFPADISVRGDELVDYIPGISPTRLADLTRIFDGVGLKVLPRVLEIVSNVSKAQFLLFTSVYELESETFDALKANIPFPVFPVGPSVGYLPLENSAPESVPSYIQWLDSQPESSVLYISLGSFLSVSSAQLDEILAGVRDNGTRFLWVARGDVSRIEACCEVEGNMRGLVVPWCDQLRVLCHASVGAFWTHCGWNSTLEAFYSGVPMLTFPIFWDQIPNSKKVVQDLKVGHRVRKEIAGSGRVESLATRQEIAEIVARFMDPKDGEMAAMRQRASRVREHCRGAVAEGGSSNSNLDAFIRDISRGSAV